MRIFRIEYLAEERTKGGAVVTLRFHAEGMNADTLRALKATTAIPEPVFKRGDRVRVSAKCKSDIGADLESERFEGDRTEKNTREAHESLQGDDITIATIEANDGEWYYTLRSGKILFPGLHHANDLTPAKT